MDLRGWETYLETGLPVVGATVTVYPAALVHLPNTTAITSTTTDSNGMWSFTGLTDSPKDIHVNFGVLGEHRWYKGFTKTSIVINGSQIEDGTITTAKLADNAITQAKMADDSVGTAEIIAGSVGQSEIATDGVSTLEIQDNAVTLAKMADASVGTTELVDAAVTLAKLAHNAVIKTYMVIPNSTLPGSAGNPYATLPNGTINVLSCAIGDVLIILWSGRPQNSPGNANMQFAVTGGGSNALENVGPTATRAVMFWYHGVNTAGTNVVQIQAGPGAGDTFNTNSGLTVDPLIVLHLKKAS